MKVDARPIKVEGDSVKEIRMEFILTGFTADSGFRIFAFEGIGVDRARTDFTVRIDLALVRRHGIPLQELPLLCRGLLERRDTADPDRAVIFTEGDMRVLADSRAADKEAAEKRKSARRPPRSSSATAEGAPGGVGGAPKAVPSANRWSATGYHVANGPG